MKPRFNLAQLATIVFISFLSISVSCTRESSDDDTEEQEQVEASTVTAESDAEAEIIYNEVLDDVMGANSDVGIADIGIRGRVAQGSDPGIDPSFRPNACYTVTMITPTPNPFPRKVIIDFGTSPCMGPDGHTRKGKIIVTYSARIWITPGAVAEATFENFYFDSTKVEGVHRTTNTSTSNLDRSFKSEVVNGKLTRYNGNFIEWNSVRIFQQIEGAATVNLPFDDILKITGTARGRAQRGNLLVAWESTIVEPLMKRFNCRWINKGRIRSVRGNMSTNSPWVAILDFGNGPCDNLATLTINGVTHQITLR
jgi:hypothetical protein